MNEQLTDVRHDYIRYANCWEDADILIEALRINKNDRILSIGSAGDNSFSLLVNAPELIVAVDINSAQLKLIELKKAAFKRFTYNQFLEFLGFKDCLNRIELFVLLKDTLEEKVYSYWEARLGEIKLGIIHQGKFEKYFQTFHKKILPLIHSKKRVQKLFIDKTAEDQVHFFEKSWNNLRWRALFKIFFSKFVMGKFGRDPKFLKEVDLSVSSFILDRAKTHLSSVNCQKNFFLHYIMTGKFPSTLPHYARIENFDKIKKNVHRLEIFEGLAEDAFKQYKNFNKFNLSNIFEYMTPHLFQMVSKNLVENATVNARFAYWNLMVKRKMADVQTELQNLGVESENLSKIDKGFFYSGIVVDIKK